MSIIIGQRKHVDKKRTKEKQQPICLICEVEIIESSVDVLGDDAVYCEGDCKGWLHRKCVCMSKLLYDKISKSDDPYYCPNCIVAKQSEEIFQLRNQMKDLSVALAGMKVLEQKVADLETELSMIRNRPTFSNPIPSASVPSTPAINSSISQQKNTDVSNDHKFNLVIYGIPECSSSSKRFERLQLDQRNVLKELSNLDDSINSSCIKNTFI